MVEHALVFDFLTTLLAISSGSLLLASSLHRSQNAGVTHTASSLGHLIHGLGGLIHVCTSECPMFTVV